MSIYSEEWPTTKAVDGNCDKLLGNNACHGEMKRNRSVCYVKKEDEFNPSLPLSNRRPEPYTRRGDVFVEKVLPTGKPIDDIVKPRATLICLFFYSFLPHYPIKSKATKRKEKQRRERKKHP